MAQIRLIPHPALRPYVQHYAYTDQGTEGTWSPSHLAATGCCALTLCYGSEGVTLRENDHKITRFEPLAFVAQSTRFKSVYLHNRVRAFFVIFRPCGALRLLGIRQEEITNQCINLSELLGSRIRPYVDALSAQDQAGEICGMMEAFLLECLRKNKMVDAGKRLFRVMEYIKQHSHLEANLLTSACQCMVTPCGAWKDTCGR